MIDHESTITAPLGSLLKNLCLPTFASSYQELAESFELEKKTYTDYLHELTIREMEHRRNQRIARLLKQAKLSKDKLTSPLLILNVSKDSLRPKSSILQQESLLTQPRTY